MVPPGMDGYLVSVAADGKYTINDTLAVLQKADGTEVNLTMVQKWPVRVGRPYKHKYPPRTPLLSGQRIVDACSPWPRAAPPPCPGPSAPARLWVQHQLAKWADVDIVVYIGCGERGNGDDRRAPGVPGA